MGKDYEYPSLFETFQLGDRVMRIYKDKLGKKIKYKGIILKIEKNSIEVYWDTKNDEYKSEEMNTSFTHCDVEEIFRGDGYFTPIKKEKSYLYEFYDGCIVETGYRFTVFEGLELYYINEDGVKFNTKIVPD